MKTVDFSNYKFHPSGLKMLMTNSKTKSEPLSETTKSYLNEIFIEEVFGRKKLITSPAMRKGTTVETDSLDLLQQVSGEVYFKNKEQLENEYLVGTPDVVDSKTQQIVDIKSSWDIWTFARVTAESALKDYSWQLTGYMWLTGFKKASLVYALVNTPDFIMNDELYRLSFKLPPEADTDLYKINFLFDDIDLKLKIKRFNVELLEENIDSLKSKIELSREYLKSLTL